MPKAIGYNTTFCCRAVFVAEHRVSTPHNSSRPQLTKRPDLSHKLSKELA
jgi:hypothetical protein